MLMSVNVWGADPVVLFHETFGDNSGSARDWDNDYSVKSGVAEVYSGVSYMMTNVKQGKNTTGQTKSGLNQSTKNVDAVFEVGPLNVTDYKTLNLSHYWKPGSTKGTYTTKVYFKTSNTGTYTEITHSAVGGSSFVQVSVNIPSAADKCETLYLKIVFNTSNTQAIIDEVELQGVFDGATPTEPSLSVSPATIDFGTVYQNAEVDAKDVTITFANLTTNDVAAVISGSAFSINKTGSFTSGDKITITPSTADLGEYEETLTLSATGVDDQTVTIKMNVVEAPVLVTYNKVTSVDDLAEGDVIVLASSTTAYGVAPTDNHTYIDAKKFAESSATLTDNVLKAADAYELTLAKSGDNWTMTSADGIVGTTAAKKMTFGSTANGNVTTWSISIDASANASITSTTSTYGTIKYNSTSPRFLNYASGQTDIQIFKKEVPAVYSKITLATCENGSVSVTGAADLTSVASGTTITLGNTPADGYKLDAYDVYKTDDATTKVTVKDGKFKMPAYAVTVSATFSLSIETPVLSEAAGDKDDAFSVKVTNYNGDYSYYYTLDGTDPTNASTPYVDADGIAINASCTLKVIAYKGDVTSPVVSAAYTLPLMTMDAIFAAAGSSATSVRVKFTDCVVTGVSGDNVYLTDNAGKGLIIYQSGHGFVVNDKLNGVVNVQLLLYRGSSEIKGLTSSTDGLTVTKDGSVSPITTMSIASLSGVNTGAVLSYTNLIYDNGYFSDGENTIQPYNTFKIADYPDFADGDKYNVTGVYIQYSTTKEIAPRSLDDLEKIEATKYAINLSSVENGSISTDPETEAADGIKVTLSATPDAGYMLGEWSVVDAESNPVEVTANQFTMPAMAVTVSATFVELPIWATTYTSNVTISGNKVKLAGAYQPADYPEDGYDAKKDGSTGAAASISVKVPANTTGLHYHLFAWKGEGGKTVSIKKDETVLATFTNIADDGVSGGSTTYELINNPVDAYGYVALEDITEETTITFSTSAKNNRICLFGVNAIQPAAITIDPASKDFGEVKQGFDAEQVFTLTPNAFATGTITAEIVGDGVFSASTIADNEVTVTFAPTEITDYSATLVIKHDGTQMCTATLTGKGITPTTPEIVVYDDEIDFGKVKQDATIADQAVTVTLNYLDAATASISEGAFTINKTNLVAGENTITISATASSVGPKSATITITGEGATTKTIAVKMDVTSKWAGEYTSNVEVGSDKVIISEEEYEAHKAGGSKTTGSTKITVPEGAHTLHFHAAGWNNEDVTLAVKNGDAELGSFSLYKDAGVSGSGPSYTLQGENYDTDQYFYVEFEALEAETEFTFAATSGNRFVLYGVNQEGGVLPVLDHITIDGEATKLNYNTTDAFDPVGLTVNAVYTLKGVEQTPVPVTENVNWTFDPATFNEVGEGLSVTATASFTDGETKTADKVITGISVEEAIPSISASKVNIEFGEVIQGATVEPIQSKITLKYIDEVSVTLSDATAFSIDKTSMTETDYLTISAVTSAEVGEYTATVTIKDLNSETSKVLNLSITIKEAPQAESYTLVTDASTLKAGDIVVMAATYSNKTYVNGDLSGDLLTCVEATLTDDVLSAVGACEFTLAGGEAGAWTLTSADGTLGATAVKKLTYEDTKAGFVGTWTISISNNVATIAPDAEGYGRFMYNHNNGGNRFLTYTSNTSASMLLPQLYRKPVYETIRENVTDGTIGTMVYGHNITAIAGAVIYEPNYVEGNVLEFIEVPVDETVAGLPYIFVADGTNDGKVQVKFGAKVPEDGCEYKHRGLVGNMGAEAIYVDASNGAYAIYQNQIRPANYTKVAVGRAYIEDISVLYALDPIETAAPRRRFSLGIERSMPTGFETIMMQKGMNKVIMNNQLYLIRDGKLFNAQGALVK